MATKVLLTIDGRHSTTTAEEYTIKLNEKMPLSVLLLNVVTTKELDGRGINPDFKESVLSTKRKYSEKSVAEVADAMKKAGIEYERRVATGEPARTICKIAEAEGFELVVIAENETPDLRERHIGSVARNVLYHCRTPVLLVKHPPRK